MQEKDKEKKVALRENNRLTAKDFINMRRGKLKEEKNNSATFAAIRTHITNGDPLKLEEALLQNKPQAMLTFLFSEDELKQTPVMHIIKSEHAASLLKAVNNWSAKFSDLIIRQIYMEDNELKSNDFRSKFQNLNKLVLQVINERISAGRSVKEEIVLLGERDSLFFHLCKNFLKIELIVSSLNNLKTKNDLLTYFYCQLLASTDLRELAELAAQVNAYQLVLTRDRLWKKVDSALVKAISLSNVELLTLVQLGYNIWHELANHSPKQFFKTCEAIANQSIEEQLAVRLWEMLLEVDSSGEIATDKCLRLWSYAQIKQLMVLSKSVDNIMLSTSCLLKVFRNRRLKQAEREALITEFLQGEIAAKGYIKVLPKMISKLQNSKKQGQQLKLQIKPIRFTYNICYDKLQVKKQLDNCGDYPLITYLKIYRGNCNLKTVQQLFMEAFSRKYAKKMSLLLKKTLQVNKSVENNSEKMQEIEQLFDYYQPLWKIITHLPHGDLLEFLISKIYVNCNEIHIKKKYAFTDVRANGLHFISYYIRNNPFLGEDSINKALIQAIINCKESQKTASKYGLTLELIRSLVPLPIFHTSQEYLVTTLRTYIKEQVLALDPSQFLLARDIWDNFVLLDSISKSLFEHRPTILTQQQFGQKFTFSLLKDYFQYKMYLSQSIQKSNKRYFQTVFSKYQPQQPEDEHQQNLSDLSIKNLFQVQQRYLSKYPKHKKNAAFFGGLKSYLSSITEIEHANEKIHLKFYSFRLRPDEKHLTYKFKRLLMLGIDPYFSKYTKSDYQFQEEEPRWGRIMKRMVQQKCTFMFAFITDDAADFSQFADIFHEAISAGKESAWIGWSLPRKIHDLLFHVYRSEIYFRKETFTFFAIKKQLYFSNIKLQPLNFKAVVFILEIADKLGFPLQQYFSNLIKSFCLHVKEMIRQIQCLSEPGKEVTKQLQLKKKKYEQMIDEWVPYMFKRQSLEQERYKQECRVQTNPKIEQRTALMVNIQGLWQQSHLTLLGYAHSKKDHFLSPLVKNKQLKDIPYRYHIFMLNKAANPFLELSNHFQEVQRSQLAKWLKFLVRQNHNQLVALYKRFMVKQLLHMINIVIKAINHHSKKDQQQEQDDKNLFSSLRLFLKIILESVSPQNAPDIVRFIQDDSTELQGKEKYILGMLHSTTNIKLISLNLLVIDRSNNDLFCIDYEGQKPTKKLRKFSSVNFYSKCNEQMFNTYLQTLTKHHQLSKHLPQHLKRVVSSIVERQLWTRLSKIFDIKALRQLTARLIIKTLYIHQKNAKQTIVDPLQNLISSIFAYFKGQSYEFDEDLFVATHFFNYREAFTIFKPTLLSIYGFKSCIQAHPESAHLFLTENVALNLDYLPVELERLKSDPRLSTKQWFPIVTYSRFDSKPWLVDVLEIELRLLNALYATRLIYKTLKSCCYRKEILKRRHAILSDLINDQQICKFILRNRATESLDIYKQFIPNMENIVKEELIHQSGSKKGRCRNLSILNPKLLKNLIKQKYFVFKEKADLFSCFLRVMETADIELLELFTKVNTITINIAYFREIQTNLSLSLWDHLLSISNQTFVTAFITKYQLFQIYSKDQYSPKLLNSICRLRRNKLLQFTIKYFQAKTGKKAVFVAESQTSKPCISENAVFFMPVQESIDNNYYQTYFLITGCKNLCPMFNVSVRFLSYAQQDQWNFIPEMKRRVELNNAFMKCLNEASEMKFRQDVLLPSIFQLQKMRRKKPRVAEEGPSRPKPSAKGYTESLSKFIFGLTNKSLSLSPESGSFEKLCFMIFKSAQTKIPEALIEKKYPAQMKIISSIRKFLDDQEVNISIYELFAYVPEFKSLLLIYNPQVYLSNPQYMYEIMGEGNEKLDYSEYLRGIQINFIEFETKYYNVLERYILNYFFKSSIPIGHPKASLHLTREALVLLFLEVGHYQRKWHQCPIFNICAAQIQRENRLDDSPQEILYDLSMNLNVRGNGEMAFDLMGWNKIIAEIQEIQSNWKTLGRGLMNEYSFTTQERNNITGKYSDIIAKKEAKFRIINMKEVLNEIYDQHVTNCNKKGALIELSLIMNSFLLINDIKVLDDKLKSIKGGSIIQKYNISLVKAIKNQVSFNSPTELSIEVKYNIEGHQSKQLSLLIVDYQATIQKLQHSLYYSDFLQHAQVEQINTFCAKADRQPFLKNYKFRYAVNSFASVPYESLLNILEHGNWKNDGVIGKMLYEMQKMEERLIGTKNIKVYSTSDIYGPINFSDEVDNQKIIDCLGFYELIQLPKDQEISIFYADKNAVSPQQRNIASIKQLKSYLEYYIALAKDQVPSPPNMGNQICVSIRKEKGEEKVELDWWRFGGWTVCEVYCLVLNYCSDLSSKIEKILDVRVSFQSLIEYYEKYLEVGQGDGLKIALQRLLFQKGFNRLVESIIIMITEDVGNIMKIVKGIIIRWDINSSSSKKRANIVISQFASAISVGYAIKDQLLYITINLDMKKQLNVGVQGEDCTLLVDRKEFLDSVFTSAQFLTDYFLMRNELNTACLNISTSLTNRLNSTVNFHIQYGNLYSHVDKMRDNKTIKDIQSFLLRLRQYLLASMEKVLTLYINSQEIANQHQVFLLNKCESINRNVTFDVVQGAKTLQYDSLEIQPKSGLFQTNALMAEIGNEQAIKSTFLIQIFKSYYTTMVGQGMTFVVGYKSGKKKAQVIKITKAENINLINILELDYIMLVSRNLPTTDQLNHSKIIRIFLTDSNRNLYRLADPLARYFLELPDEHEDRSLAHFAPLIPSNIRLAFYQANQREKDPRDTKTFFIDLGDPKFKLAPLPDRPLTPLNSCKKNYQFKEAIGQLQRGFNKFCTESIKIVIDLPQEFTEKYVGVNFSHIVHLVGSDILQFLLKWEFQPMRNASLDCKLSAEKQFMVNKNSIIELRKRAFLSYFRSICISIREEPSKISFKGKEITVSIDTSNMATLPSSSQYLSAILDNILSKQKSLLPKFVRFEIAEKNESTEVLLKEFDLINCISYQVQQIQTAITLIKHFFDHKIEGFGIHIQKKKTQVRFEDGIHLHLNVESGERQFYSAEDLIRLFIASRNKGHQPNTKSQTYYDFRNMSIVIEDSAEEKYTLAYFGADKQWHMSQVTAVKDNSRMMIPLPKECVIPSRYYLLQSLNIYSNYTFDIDKDLAITDKNSEGIRGKSKILYLQSQKEVNLNFTNINVTETNPLFKDITNNFNILQKINDKNVIEVHLLSKNLYSLCFKYAESMILNLNFAGHINPLNTGIDSTKLVISSDGALCLENTKFLELEGYKRKPVLIKERENQAGSQQFRESHEQASQIQFQSKPGDANNIQNLVYVVNDECKKFLTRAGEHRVDYLQLCDADNNPIDYKEPLDVKFVHINRLAVVQPEIFRRGMQFGLRWTPTVRGHYYIYINGTRMSPPYEIGVCAGQADYKKTITTLPKIQKLCYCEESELMLDLRDSFGNLYTQLQEDILGDSLLIEMKCSNMAETLKIDKTPINKYGLKKLKFSFNNGDAEAPSSVEVQLYLNCEFVCKFSLIIQGLSLKQRKKLLDKDISLNSKNYYKDITVNRNKFLEELFTIAEKSLHTNLSVKFVNQPGIDAGGVKREFYDMIGNQIKSERNPFFKLINPNTMEYFLNPEILRNKKKLEYMELWGKYLANSFLNSYLIGVSFSPVFVKLLYDQTINFQDLLSVLPVDQRKQYEYLLTAAPEDFEDLDLYFTAMVDKKKCVEVELLEGGKSKPVTAENVKQYLQCTAQVLLTERYREIIIAFRKGFETVLELGIFKKWIRNTEFWCLTAGNKELTAQLVLNYIVFQGNNIDNISGWFRRFINQATPEILIGFLKFSSGSSSIDFSLASKVTVTFENGPGENPKKLPISHTCWKEIVVPKYKNYDIMKKLLTAAFIYCSEGFGFG